MEVIVYSKSGCPYCEMAKNYLRDHNVSYVEHIIDDLTERQLFYSQVGAQTMPQIFVVSGGSRERIGGYQELIGSDVAQRYHMDNDDHWLDL